MLRHILELLFNYSHLIPVVYVKICNNHRILFHSWLVAAGLLALACWDSFTVALLLASVLGLAWLADWAQGPKYTGPKPTFSIQTFSPK